MARPESQETSPPNVAKLTCTVPEWGLEKEQEGVQSSMICLLPSTAMFITVMFGGKRNSPVPEHHSRTQELCLPLYPRGLGRRDTDGEGCEELRKLFSRGKDKRPGESLGSTSVVVPNPLPSKRWTKESAVEQH